ncbi:unnamed protein product [Anisakis simplex]|uniref:enoyl-CoA hydratase n=1 Tax=Anisakis simplex TaxID=6269 RepID=A0A0M3J2V5_ANISI|nr:unnamed protein product [Anisakis simplex]VDK55055.1 unnamed protein product [Anisakis simplex]
MEMCLTGDKMSATEAKDCGIVSKVFPGEVLLDETIKLAEKIARNSSLISAIVKESVNNAYETTLQQGLATERKLFHSTFATNDIKEGMQAFIEKRSPQWSNQ